MQYGDLARVYDLLAYDLPYARWYAFAQNALAGCRTVAELGCGTGNMTRLLARDFDVTAQDISTDMLEKAAEKLRKSGAQARLVQGDMRTFRLHKPVDAVVCFCDGINYLTSPEDVRQTFDSVFRALKPGGRFLFDVSSEQKLRAMADQLYSEDTDAVTYIWRNAFDESARCLTMDLTFFCAQGGQYARFDETHIQRAHTREELSAWLCEAGFSVRVTEDYTENPASEQSERLSFLAERK
ncbi:MAG: class I SAM-dependent methyltransferase [Clostridia bacterium]|nr:class I SAM-dependent methyltransferase [Clostridia bacterium]